MYQLIDGFLDVVGIFFIVYLIGYSTFLFLSVVVGSIQLYRQGPPPGGASRLAPPAAAAELPTQ